MSLLKEDRRDFLKKSSLLLSSAIIPSEVFAKTRKPQPLYLFNTHIQKVFRPKVFTDSWKYDIIGLFELDKAMMDYRTYQIKRIDLKLVNLLYKIQSYIGFDRKIYIISGYRSPATNNYLRKHSYGVAKNSYHVKAKAADIHIEGMRLSRARDIIRGINENGGVGYYPNSGFIHTDVGPKRSWMTLG